MSLAHLGGEARSPLDCFYSGALPLAVVSSTPAPPASLPPARALPPTLPRLFGIRVPLIHVCLPLPPGHAGTHPSGRYPGHRVVAHGVLAVLLPGGGPFAGEPTRRFSGATSLWVSFSLPLSPPASSEG
jgi:hypothetical protein